MAKELLTQGQAVVGGLYVKRGLALHELTETHLASTFADGLGAVGTKLFTGAIPAGAIVLGGKVVVTAGFVGSGNNAAAMKVGDGTTADRYNTATINVYVAAANGIDLGLPSGVRFHDVAKTPKITVTMNSDFTSVLAGGGSITVSLFYITTLA